MSTEINDTWVIGETWSEIISCTDENGAAINPTSASYKLKSLDGLFTLEKTESNGIDITGNVCTVVIPTTPDQTGFVSRDYYRRLKVIDSNGAVSRQVNGIISVLPAYDD